MTGKINAIEMIHNELKAGLAVVSDDFLMDIVLEYVSAGNDVEGLMQEARSSAKHARYVFEGQEVEYMRFVEERVRRDLDFYANGGGRGMSRRDVVEECYYTGQEMEGNFVSLV